ncbi:MAG TPA: lipase maturation factor family protein [Kofleriaceae bacterium]|nr:lipase maturation factor family protein [Kofleriaceae bacterium]
MADVPSPWQRLVAWLGGPRRYTLARFAILRLLGVVYVFAFLGIVYQGPALLGSHGLTPVGAYVDRLHAAGLSFWDVPSVFMWSSSDHALALWAYLGLALSVCLALGYANAPSLLVLWFLYGSYERVGQLWFGFGWEMQLLETTVLAAAIAHPWDPRPLAPRPPPTASIVLMRWLVFRIMLGAGLIKLRGDACWRDLTCLDYHFETQPIPNPLSAWFHHLPHVVHAIGVVFNHVVEVVAPWFVFGPRRLRLVAGALMLSFQVVLILSGNLAFLNWLTVIPVLACFDDDALLALLPRRVRGAVARRLPEAPPRDWRQLLASGAIVAWVWLTWHYVTSFRGGEVTVERLAALPLIAGCGFGVYHAVRLVRRHGARLDLHQLAVGALVGLVLWKSMPVVYNLAAHRQAMNRSFDRLELVNTYGAFGSVGDVRHELVIEGTMAEDPTADDAEWRAYELPCKPGDVDRRPCILGPYHLRLDWLIWFSAMDDQPSDPWILHLVWKLLDGDRTIRELIAVDPFGGKPPRWVRIRRFVYHLEPLGADTWWRRDTPEPWLPPVALDTPGFRDALEQYGWPSPSVR